MNKFLRITAGIVIFVALISGLEVYNLISSSEWLKAISVACFNIMTLNTWMLVYLIFGKKEK